MKAFLAAVFTSFTIATFGQQKVFEPEGFSVWPNIHPDSMARYNTLVHAADSLFPIYERKGFELDSFILDEQEILVQAERLSTEGPYDPGPIGCSWYCAPEWDTTYSSSNLKNIGAITYGADNAFDMNVSTAWVEGVKGDGIGETFSHSIKVGDTHQMASVEIYNGYCKDVTTWRNNNRVKELEMYVNGKNIGILHLADSYLGQRFSIGSFYSINGKLVVQFKIKSVYKGDKYDDTAISDILFDGKYSH